MDLVSSIRKSGSRGGVNFSWDDVASSTHRENYLGHSLKAPVGRWQQGRDLTWYAKSDAAEGTPTETEEEKAARERKEEIKRVKEAEEDALARALGLPVAPRNVTGANSVDVGEARGAANGPRDANVASRDRADGREGLREGRASKRAEDAERRHRRRHRSRSRSRERRRERSPRRRDDYDGHRPRDYRREERRRTSHSHNRDDDRHRREYRRRRSRSRSLGEPDMRKVGGAERRRNQSGDRRRSRSPDPRRRIPPGEHRRHRDYE